MSDSLPLFSQMRLEDVCARFERAWQEAGPDDPPPRMGDYIGNAAGPELAVLVRELLLLDVHYRADRGLACRADDYPLPLAELDSAWLAEVFKTPSSVVVLPASPPAVITPPTVPATECCGSRDATTGQEGPLPRRVRYFGEYELLEEVARGGMGVVYRAGDPGIGRSLAVKVLREEYRERPEWVLRFVAEAQITGQLQHPGVPPVHERGCLPDGRPFFAMKLIQGRTLAELLKARADPSEGLPRFLAVFAAVCQVMAYAHSREIIHRDLKPSNVMVGPFGEAQVMDWGLAKVLKAENRGPEQPATSGTEHTVGEIRTVRTETQGASSLAGHVLGTCAYMPPEQARGEVDQLDERADVFCLGAILCEILTGSPPFASPERDERLAQATACGLSEAIARLDNCRADPELVRLAKACLSAEPQARPKDAGVLARELTGEWLRRKQRATWRGRAELCLSERAELWAARPEHRRLPSGPEWLGILFCSASRNWTVTQRKMMTAATRRYALRLAIIVVLVALCGWATWEGWGHLRAASLVSVLRVTDTADAPDVIRELTAYRRWAVPMLQRLATDSDQDSRERLHAALALLPYDRSQIDYLVDRLPRARPQELAVIRDALRPHAAEASPRLVSVLESDAAGPRERFNAALASAGLDMPSTAWGRHGTLLVDQLLATVQSDPASYAILAEGLRPVRFDLLNALGAVLRDRGRPEYDRRLATTLVADYAADRPRILADLLLDADADQYAVLLPKLSAFPVQATTAMRAELDRRFGPRAQDSEKEAHARRQASAAVTLLHFGQCDPVWPLLSHQEDPRLRSHLIHRLHLLGADPRLLAERLLIEPGVSIRRALILGLGDYPADSLPDGARQSLTARVREWYRDDIDPGIHSAVEWLLRRWDPQALPNLAAELPISTGPVGGRRWYVNHQGLTFAAIPGPVTVAMGSPPDDADSLDEPIIRRHIGRSFAVATTPVTRAQFERFLRFRRRGQHAYTRKYCPDPDCPAIGINWFMAAEYCRWLSETEGVPEEQMCFPPFGDIKEGMKLPPDYLRRNGYRLLTDAEWEYACRAGAVTSRFYGSTEDLLGRYAWYAGNSQVRTHPVGSLRPNEFGLFDTHGNIWQWCQERGLASRPWGSAAPPPEDREDTDPVAELHARVLRGGGFYDHASFLRCAARLMNRPYVIDDYFGFRVARTIR
jgi:formylglycine-generating enzyme required for sulfatase activity/serine/threonine protein kinase